jgi:uncharacterized membrane protein
MGTMRSALSLALLLAAAGPAAAGLSVCNKGAHPVKVAIGLFDGTHWSSRGWWHVPAKACMPLVPGRLVARYYYMYATDGTTGSWDGGRSFCTAAADRFAIIGRGECTPRGYDHHAFFEIDTGNQLDFTQKLSD